MTGGLSVATVECEVRFRPWQGRDKSEQARSLLGGAKSSQPRDRPDEANPSLGLSHRLSPVPHPCERVVPGPPCRRRAGWVRSRRAGEDRPATELAGLRGPLVGLAKALVASRGCAAGDSGGRRLLHFKAVDLCCIKEGLACFRSVTFNGCTHQPIVAGGRHPNELPEFKWVNTFLGNQKPALAAPIMNLILISTQGDP